MSYLSAEDMKSFGQTCVSFRNIYHSASLREVVVFRPKHNSKATRELFNPRYRLISANVFFNPERFSWYDSSCVNVVHFHEDSLDPAVLPGDVAQMALRYTNVTHAAIAIKQRKEIARYEDLWKLNFCLSLSEIPVADLKCISFRSFAALATPNLLKSIKTLELRSYAEIFANFPPIPFDWIQTLENISFIAPRTITLEHYRSVIEGIASLPLLKRVWTSHFLSAHTTYKLVSILPNTLLHNEISLSYPDFDPLLLHLENDAAVDFSNVTHLNLMLEDAKTNASFPLNCISSLSLSKLKSLRIHGSITFPALAAIQNQAGGSALESLNLYIADSTSRFMYHPLSLSSDFMANIKTLTLSFFGVRDGFKNAPRHAGKKVKSFIEHVFEPFIQGILIGDLLSHVVSKPTPFSNRSSLTDTNAAEQRVFSLDAADILELRVTWIQLNQRFQAVEKDMEHQLAQLTLLEEYVQETARIADDLPTDEPQVEEFRLHYSALDMKVTNFSSSARSSLAPRFDTLKDSLASGDSAIATLTVARQEGVLNEDLRSIHESLGTTLSSVDTSLEAITRSLRSLRCNRQIMKNTAERLRRRGELYGKPREEELEGVDNDLTQSLDCEASLVDDEYGIPSTSTTPDVPEEDMEPAEPVHLPIEEIVSRLQLLIPTSNGWVIPLRLLVTIFCSLDCLGIDESEIYQQENGATLKPNIREIIFQCSHIEEALSAILHLKKIETLGLFMAPLLLTSPRFHYLVREHPTLRAIAYTEEIEHSQTFMSNPELTYSKHTRPCTIPDAGTSTIAPTAQLLDVVGYRQDFAGAICNDPVLNYYDKKARHNINMKDPTIRESLFGGFMNHYHRWAWKS